MSGKIKKVLGLLLLILLMAAAFLGIIVMTVSSHVVSKEKDRIVQVLDSDDAGISKKADKKIRSLNPDCVLILGAGIKDSETPSPMLKDRLDAGLKLYQDGLVPKILISGDNGTVEHNEIHVMLKYLEKHGVPSQDIFCDHAGFCTSDSVHRAKKIFGVRKMVIATQEYHLYRALYLSEKTGIKALGVASNQRKYAGQPMREIREVSARNKDFINVLLKKDSSVGGMEIPISGDGTVSHGE